MKDNKKSIQTAVTVLAGGVLLGLLANKFIKPSKEILALIVVGGLAAGFFIDKKIQKNKIKVS